jgi:biotin transporter BioY
MSWLAAFVGWKHAFTMGFYPFLSGDALKVLIVTFYITKHKRFE